MQQGKPMKAVQKEVCMGDVPRGIQKDIPEEDKEEDKEDSTM